MTADPLPPLRDVIAKYELRAKKSLGQNFILDLNLTRRIARSAGPLDNVCVYEVGPGPGGLTRALLMEGAQKVIAVERDDRVLPALDDISAAYPGRLEIISGDAMALDELALLQGRPAKIVANLPYNVGTALFVRWMTGPWMPWWQSLTLMFQREVAERIIARPGSKAYGRLSVLAQWRAETRILFNLPQAAFTPAPKVASAIIQITPKEEPKPLVDQKILETVVATAFAQRRKMLRASLKPLCTYPEHLLEQCGIDPTARAETVDVDGFCRLARAYSDMKPPATSN